MACEDCKKDLKNICKTATERGHLQCLIWVCRPHSANEQCSWDMYVCTLAAFTGHLDCLIWARRLMYEPCQCLWDTSVCSVAAGNGHLDCLIWARMHGCPWNEGTCAWAARKGYLECLIWARRNGCPWDIYTCAWAKRHGNMNVLKWIHKNGSPCNCMKEIYEVWNEWVEGEECNICLERLDETTVKFYKCRHHYHEECMNKMLREMTKKHCSICERTQ